MQRAILVPADLAGAAIDDLKAWLAITTTRDDATLEALLRTALEMCEGFTGQMPLAAECEEVLAADGRWQSLRTRPVQTVDGVEAVAADGARTALAPEDYAVDLDADGGACLRLTARIEEHRIAARFTAGLAAGWADLPEALRHGVLRLAAHSWRERDSGNAAPMPPAAVAALWRPWRRMRLA